MGEDLEIKRKKKTSRDFIERGSRSWNCERNKEVGRAIMKGIGKELETA